MSSGGLFINLSFEKNTPGKLRFDSECSPQFENEVDLTELL